MHIHLLVPVTEEETKKEKKSIKELEKQMPPCPICGKKAYLEHDVVDGYDFGYSAGCPSFKLNDGVHGITESFDPKAPRSYGYSAEQAFNNWVNYCQQNAINSKEKEKQR